jgi:hypothetical protein
MGPWAFYADVPSTDPNWHIVTNASRLRVIANVHIEPGNAMDLANARLIAAAPELLEALSEVVADLQFSEVPQHMGLVKIARAAIAKVRGDA